MCPRSCPSLWSTCVSLVQGMHFLKTDRPPPVPCFLAIYDIDALLFQGEQVGDLLVWQSRLGTIRGHSERLSWHSHLAQAQDVGEGAAQSPWPVPVGWPPGKACASPCRRHEASRPPVGSIYVGNSSRCVQCSCGNCCGVCWNDPSTSALVVGTLKQLVKDASNGNAFSVL